jgi:hypothetical protein
MRSLLAIFDWPHAVAICGGLATIIVAFVTNRRRGAGAGDRRLSDVELKVGVVESDARLLRGEFHAFRKEHREDMREIRQLCERGRRE